MDEMWDATDTVLFAGAPWTTETSYTAMDLAPETTVYVRVAAATGTPEAPLVSAFTTHVSGTSAMPPPPPPSPMAPATPTGLMAETGEGSITWSWDEVEGADGYAIQVSTDEVFNDMDETEYTMETTHTASDLGYGATRYARVASTSGEGEDMLKSMYTTHVTGMSMREPVPALEVSFTVPDDENPLEADDKTEKDEAMATVNTGITVTTNADVTITAMWDEDLQRDTSEGADKMPFANTVWLAKQSEVVEDGVTFEIARAGVMEPGDGDVVYVTCGPFRCTEVMMEKPAAPEITIDDSPKCTAWNPTLELQVGLIDNSLSEHTGIAYDATDTDNVVVEVTVFD